MKGILIALAVLIVVGVAICAWQVYTVQKAHSSFENYYAFRGCSQLLTRTATSATCALPSGKVITIVQYENKWYLQNDLPCPGSFFTLSHFECMI